ncbi:MAG: ATP-binding protein [Pseudobdellovibrionaceae bacterium]|nr:ATP-binding protein [Pseudobdellovibrionaceae bacterium]
MRLDGSKGQYSLGIHTSYLEDPDGRLTLEDVRSKELAPRWRQSKESVPNFGYTSSTFWFRVELFNDIITDKEWLLEIGYSHLDRIDVYRDGSQGGDPVMLGDKLPIKSREIKYRNLVDHLPMTSQESRYLYVRIKTSSSMQFPATIWSQREFSEAKFDENYAQGLYIGIVLVMIFYNMFLFVSVRDLNHLYYVFYILVYGLFTMEMQGYAFEYLWPESPYWKQLSTIIFSSLVGVGIITFTRNFLKTAQHAPTCDRLLKGFSLFYAATIPVSFYEIAYSVTVKSVITAGMFVSPLILTIGVICLGRGYRPARFFVVAFAALVVGHLLYTFRILGLIPESFLAQHGSQIGSALEMAILSIALGDRLKQEQTEANSKIEKLNIDLMEKEKARTAFFQNTSHELRTPLNGIIGFSTLLIHGRYGELGEQANQQITKIRDLADSLKFQVNAILDLAKSKRGEFKLCNSLVSLPELFSQMQNLGEGLSLKSDDLSFECSMSWKDEAETRFITDPDKLAMVVRNLLGNAFKFRRPGAHNKVSLIAVRQGPNLIITVSDTGIGIPADQQQEIFREFRQLDSDAGRAYEGTGLGLAIVNETLKLMGGSIEVNSVPNEGSRFTVTIPEQSHISATEAGPSHDIILSDPTDSRASRQVRMLPTSQKTPGAENFVIYVVDDNRLNCEVISEILGTQGYKVELAYGGRECLNRLKIFKPHLLLLDLMMPEVSGEDVLKAIRFHDELKDLPVILLTARASQEDRLLGLGLGADDYLAKPIESEELLLRVRNILTRIELSKVMEAMVGQEKMVQIGELMGDLSHELRNINVWGTNTMDAERDDLTAILRTTDLPEPQWGAYIAKLVASDHSPTFDQSAMESLQIPAEKRELARDLKVIRMILLSEDCDRKYVLDLWKGILDLDPDKTRFLKRQLNISSSYMSLWNSAKRSHNLVESVLDYTHEDSKAALCEPEAAVRSCLALLDRRIIKEGVLLRVKIQTQERAFGNQSEICQIVLNIIKNAIDAYGHGHQGGKLLSVDVREDEHLILIEIEDNAGGIPESIIEKIFERNYSTKGASGSGLGLFISKRLALKNKGSLTVVSQNGRTQFKLSLDKAIQDAKKAV